MRFRFRDKPLPLRSRVPDCDRHDPDGNPVEDTSPPVASFSSGHRATNRGNAVYVHDAGGRHIATFHALYHASQGKSGALHLHAPAITQDHKQQLRSLNEKNSEFWCRRPEK